MIQGHICQLHHVLLGESVEHLLTCVESLSSIQGRDHSANVMCCYHKQTACVPGVLSVPAPFPATFYPQAGTSSCARR